MMMQRNGFTLLELLLVIAITMILANVGFSSYVFSIKKSHDVQRKSDLGNVAKGLEVFANDFGGYPADNGSGAMIACDYNNGGLVACSWGSAFSAYSSGASVTYLTKLPTDPVNGQNYYYEKTTDGFNLYAALENTADPFYQGGLTPDCGGGIKCNYQLSESGVK